MRKLVFFLLVLSIGSCQNISSSDEYRLDEEFELGIGEQASFDNAKFHIFFKEVNEDSRCPEGVTCVWAGNGKIALMINGKKVSLNTYLEPNESDIDGYHIKLISLNPYPVYEQEIDKEAYVARLIVRMSEN